MITEDAAHDVMTMMCGGTNKTDEALEVCIRVSVVIHVRRSN